MSTIKLDYELCETDYMKSILPEGNKLKENFYAANSMMKPLSLGYQKIVMCPNFCMLYYLENAKLRIGMEKTLVAYKKLRYFSITLRLQRLFMSPKTVKHMTWHQSHDAVDEVIVHFSDAETWKHFNSL